MPLGLAVAASYSPLLYRPRDQWKAINQLLVGSVPQPYQATNEETDEVLDHYAARIEAAFSALKATAGMVSPGCAIVLACDQGGCSTSPIRHRSTCT